MTNRKRLLAALTAALDAHPGIDEAGLESVGVTWYRRDGTVKLRPEYSETTEAHLPYVKMQYTAMKMPQNNGTVTLTP